MNSSLSVVVLDVDRTLIRSFRTENCKNPYPYYKAQHCDGYIYFSLESRDGLSQNKNEHYHVYIRPGLKTLMKYLTYLQRNENVLIAIASMAKREYIDRVMKGLKDHCTRNHYPSFDAILTRESWDENMSPSTTPTYPISVILHQFKKHGMKKRINLRYKSLSKISRTLRIPDDGTNREPNILIVDDDLGAYDFCDRVSGQIYQIPPWNGPVYYHRKNHDNITVYKQKDNELKNLASMIHSITEKGSIQKFLFSRVLSVFRHGYGNDAFQAIKLRKDIINVLLDDIAMQLDEDIVVNAVWIFDNILKCCHQNDDMNDDIVSFGEYVEIMFGCIIVAHMYFYNVYPSTHFYRLSFTHNEFWKNIIDVFFDDYIRLLLHFKDSRMDYNDDQANDDNLWKLKENKNIANHNIIQQTQTQIKTKTQTKTNDKQQNTLKKTENINTNTIENNNNNIKSSKYKPKKANAYAYSYSSPAATSSKFNKISRKSREISAKLVNKLKHKNEEKNYNKSLSFISQNNDMNTMKEKKDLNVKQNKKSSIFNNNSHSNLTKALNPPAPIEVAQSEAVLLTKKSVEAQDDQEPSVSVSGSSVSLNGEYDVAKHDYGYNEPSPKPKRESLYNGQVIVFSPAHYKAIQEHLKVLVKSLSKSLFCKNSSPACFVGYNLLSPSRSNPRHISKYSKVLKKIFRNRNVNID